MSGERPVTDVRVVSELLGGSRLSLALQEMRTPTQWHAVRPSSAAEWSEHASRVAAAFGDPSWLDNLAPALGQAGRPDSRLRRVAGANGVVVTTGQQPGLFGGPVFTLSKALTALAFADELERVTGVPVAPLFWAATDDADFAEARSTVVVTEGRATRLAIEGRPPPGTPMSAVAVGRLEHELAVLEQSSGSGAHAAVIEAVRAAYSAGATVGGAYVALLRAILEPLGIAVLDASHAAVRATAAPLLRRSLEQASSIDRALAARSQAIRDAGFDPQVNEVDGLTLVFAWRAGIKERVRVDEARATSAAQRTDELSPNVLLRPIVERALLPTVAYVGGPAEIAYFAQVSAVADVLQVDRPLVVPRWSGLILEPHVVRILERLDVDVTMVRQSDVLEGRLAREAMPPAVRSSLARLREAIERASSVLSQDAGALALVPEAAVDGAKSSLLVRLARLERRYIAGIKRRQAEIMHDVTAARSHLFPDGKRQERVLNFCPMLSRHGSELLTAISDAARVHVRGLTARRV